MDDDEIKSYDSSNASDPDAFFDEEDAPTVDGNSPKIGTSSSLPSVADPRQALLSYPNSLPYKVESLEAMDERLDLILVRLSEAIEAKDWDVGFWRWHRDLSRYLAMKYPMKRERRVALLKLYFELAVSPGMEARIVETCSSMVMSLTEKNKYVSRKDITLPWRPIFDILKAELFPKGRKTGLTNIAGALLSMTESSQRFFHPSETNAMLEAFLPMMDGNNINTVVATQAFLVHFLPLTHPQTWLPMMFKLSSSFNSATFDDQMLDLLARLSELHHNPAVSDPARLSPSYVYTSSPEEDLEEIQGESKTETLSVGDNGASSRDPLSELDGSWKGIWKDVGILGEDEFKSVVTLALKSMEGQKHATGAHSDAKLSATMQKMKKPSDRIQSLAQIIIYSMSNDAPLLPESGTATPAVCGPSAMTGIETSSAQLGGVPVPNKKYLAGSKALDALAKLITNCESMFHPSNPGQSSVTTATFIWALAAMFVKRWKSEEKSSCKTPPSRRLTKEIKKEFCLSLRTVALLSMFSKHDATMALSHACLKYLSLLEPNLVIQSVLDRAYPSLTGLEETHRTPAVLACLAAISHPMISREVFYLGGRNLVPLLELCLPGIDLNDPMKTVSTAWFITNIVQFASLSDLTDFEPSEDASPSPWANASTPEIYIDQDQDPEKEPPLPIAEENQALRYSTGGLSSWLSEYVARVLTLFENLPDQGGRSLKTGGKTEETVNAMVQKSTGIVFSHLSDPLFDLALNQIFEYASSTVRANTVGVMSQLVSSLAKVNFAKVFDRFFALCAKKITSELEGGASSVPTTSASLPSSSDTTLHAYMSILSGMLAYADESILKHQDKLIELIKFANEKALNERSWSITSRLITRLFLRLTTCWTEDARFVNKEEWNSEDFKKNSHLYWGKVYKRADCIIDWHVPGEAELNFVTRLLKELVEPTLVALETKIPSSGPPSKAWTNSFCRELSFLRHCLDGLYAYYLEDPSTKSGGAVVSDKGECPPEFQAPLPTYKAAFILTDVNDSRHQEFAALRERIGKFVHRAADYLRNEGGDDSTDAVLSVISTINTFMLSQGLDARSWEARKLHYDTIIKSVKMHHRQKVLPRKAWVARAELYHLSRSRSNGWIRTRSALDDELISKLMDFSLSSYTRIRKHGQNVLDAVARSYDGTKTLVYPRILESLGTGVDPDRMKGALYLIGGKAFASFSILDPRFFGDFVLKVLSTQDQEKASIQAVINKITEDTIIRTSEPFTLRSNVPNPKIDSASRSLVPNRQQYASQPSVLAAVSQSVKNRSVVRDAAFDKMVEDLLDLAEKPTTHWKYTVFAQRYLRALVRRDRPTHPRLATFFLSRVVSDLPQLRHYAQLSMTKVLHFIKLRTMTGASDEPLLLGKSSNPLKRTIDIDPSQPNFTSDYLQAFKVPLADGDTTTFLQDKASGGWLVWGKQLTGYTQAPWDESPFTWDPSSQEAMTVMTAIVNDPEWWKKFVGWASQEDARTYLSGDAINMIKSLSQVFVDLPFRMAKPHLDEFVNDPDSNRHKQRALAELLSGLIRGSKHWPGKARKEFYDWIELALPKIFAFIKPDTLTCWELFFDYNFYKTDPRRIQVLIDFVLEKARSVDLTAGFAFEITKALTFLNCLIVRLSWRFESWTGGMVDEYFKALGNDFAEIRDLLADNLHQLAKTKWHISNPSAVAFVEECQIVDQDVMGLHRSTDLHHIQAYVKSLAIWREERPSGPTGPSSTYDKHSLGLLRYVHKGLIDLNGPAAFTNALPLIEEIFQMRELKDSPALQAASTKALAFIAGISPPLESVKPLLFALLQTLRSHKSWHIRLHVLPVLATVYFRGLPLVDDATASSIMEVLTECLTDKNLEVRDLASSCLSTVLRCSQRASIVVFKNRFQKTIRQTQIPKRRLENGDQDPAYTAALTQMHAAVLGVGAIVEAFPYTVPHYVPELLAETLAAHASDPIPVSTTVRKVAAAFKASHQDTWENEDKKRFTEDQLSSLTSILSGTSYYA